MALELIGGIASIAQLAGTIYTISKTLYEVGEALSNAPSDIKDLARDLETFSDELHLLSTLLHGKDGRYADQVYRLTAKIIGDSATICTKIDRIIRKLKSGNMWAKVKWLYKEKEIMKLLARLRDLKLSLMGTLSVLSALRADHMMDSLGIQNSSLIGGQKGHDLSVETRKQVEDTKMKLAGLTIKDDTQSCSTSKTMVQSSVSSLSGSSSTALSLSATSGTYIGSAASRTPSTASFATSAFISMATTPSRMPPLLNSKALESVDSFHSAVSSHNEDEESVKIWRNEMALSAVKHFNMEKKDAEEWAMRLPVPSKVLATTPHAEKYGQLGTANNMHELGNHENSPFSQPNSTPMDFQGQQDEDDSFYGYSPTSVGYSPIDGDSPETEALQADATLTSSTEEKKRPTISRFEGESLTVDESPLMDNQEGQEMKPATSSTFIPIIPIKKASHSLFTHNDERVYGAASKIESFPSKPTDRGRKAQQQQSQIPPRLLPTQYPPTMHNNDEIIFPQNLHHDGSIASFLYPYPGPSHQPPLLDYQTQITLLDDQNKRRLAMTRQEQQAGRQQLLGKNRSNLANTALQMNMHSDEHAQQGHQRKLMLLEEQNKKRLMMARQERRDKGDYQEQLMLLEQQNRKRLMMAQKEQQDRGDWQRQSMLLEEQNRKRSTMAQLEQQNHNPVLPPATMTSGDNTFDGTKNFSVDTDYFRRRARRSSTAMPSSSSSLQGEASQLHSQPYQQVQTQRQQQMSQQSSHQIHEIKQSQQVQIQRQASQQSHTSVNQPHNQPTNLMRKTEKFIASAADHTGVIPGPASEVPNMNPSIQPINQFLECQMALSHRQNEASDQGLGGLWSRALTEVKSFDQLIYGNLQRLLASEGLFITSTTNLNPLFINPDWSANPCKERVASYCQIFPSVAGSIQRILDILGVMEETIGFKIGAIAWASLLIAVEDLFSIRTKLSIDLQIEIITELAEIASIIARYTVMENIYAQWKGMTLERDYKESLINLSTHILIYIGTLFSLPKDVGVNLNMKPYFHKVVEADTACRGFTVIFSSEIGARAVDQKRSIGDISDDSDESDDTVMKGDKEIGMKDSHLPAKRMRI